MSGYVMMELIMIGIWFCIPIAVFFAFVFLYRAYQKQEADISAPAVFFSVIFVLWIFITISVWRDNIKITTLREKYGAQVKREGADENGDLWITIEAENTDKVYSTERGDTILKLVEEGSLPCDYPVGYGANYKTQHYWRYQIIGSGECELRKIRLHESSWENDDVVAYRISVDENGDMNKTVEYGEMPNWLGDDAYADAAYINKAYDFYARNVVFLYGENLYKKTDMSGELYRISIPPSLSGRSDPTMLYICPDIRRIYYYDTRANDIKIWKEFRISDDCDISWIKEWVNEYYQDDSTDLIEY